MILCRALGPVEVVVDDGPAPAELLWRKNLALLVYLARSPKRSRSRDHLVGLLWGDKPESAARHSLNEAVRVLRKHAGEGSVESEGGQLRLAETAVELDVERFVRWLDEGKWGDAAELISGEFMEGFGVPGCSEFEEWLYAERSELRERSVDALVRYAGQQLDGGGLREAAATARRGLALDPLSDQAALVAMRSLAIAGERAAALELYESFAARLDDELGIEPSEEVRSLAERVRRERTWKLPERLLTEAERGSRSRRAPLVGRESELGQLHDAWVGCRAECRATLAMIQGDPGTGRTRLAEELLARARLDGAVVASLRAVEADMKEPGNGILGIARALSPEAASLDDAPAAALGVFAARLPGWRERYGASADGEPSNLGPALVEVLRAVTESQPALMFLDDAHWIDRDSLLAIGRLLRDLERAPLMILTVAAGHPERAELEELQAGIGHDLAGVSLQLGPLSTPALRALGRWALPRYDDVELDRVTRRVSTDSAGLPLLAVELLHAVAVGLDLNTTAGAWPAPSRTLSETLPGDLPDAVVAAVRVGFRRLTADAQTVLAAAAVLGDRIDRKTLQRAVRLEAPALDAALDELEWQRWLAAESRGYSFVARIVRDVVARDMLTAGQRERILQAAGAG
jgi:DNA-binding SARP family transcriptional activator